MVIKKVTVKFDSCIECPIHRYVGCPNAYTGNDGEIPGDCPIETSAMLNRYTEFSSPRSSDRDSTPMIGPSEAMERISKFNGVVKNE